MTQGDHVRALRGGAWDHAIDLGDRTVIRFVPGRGLERTEYAGFAEGAERVEVVVHRERIYRPPLVVARAFSRFAESAYGGMFQTAEQFAAWCKSGQLPAQPGDGAPVRRRAQARKAVKARPARKPRPAAKKARRPAGRAKAGRAPAGRKGKPGARPAGRKVRKAPRSRRR